MNSLAFIAPGGGELILIMLVLIMLFGAKDAPRILRKFQGFMDELRRISNAFRYDMMYSDLHPDPSPDDDAIEGEFETYDYESDYGHDEEDAPVNELPEVTVVEHDEIPEKTEQ